MNSIVAPKQRRAEVAGAILHSLPARNEWGESRREGMQNGVATSPLPSPPRAAEREERQIHDLALSCRAGKACAAPAGISAFTLIELMIAVGLGALILASGYACLNAAIASRKTIEPRSEVFQNARVAMAIITADLRNACPLSKDFEFLGMRRQMGEMDADNVDFATHNYTPARANEGDFCEVSYFVGRDRETGKYSLWRRRNPTIAPDPLSGGRQEEIARGIQGVRFEYFD